MRSASVWAIVACLVVGAAAPGSASAGLLSVLVPAYANPASPGGPTMWSSLIATAGDPGRQFELRAIFNPASGPGTSREPNYLTVGGTGPLNDFRVAGGITDGYVPTKHIVAGNLVLRPIGDVKADVDAYLTGFYAGYVDGIFFDDMSNDLADVGFYQDLQAYVKAIKPDARTFGNPGTTFVNNPSAQSTYDADDFIHSLDTIVVFENTQTEYLTNYTSFPHLLGLGDKRLAHIVHTVAPWDPSLLALAAAREAHYVYFTDDVMPNPYDELTSFWGPMTRDVSAFNAAAVPEPASLWTVAIAGALFFARRRRA